MFRNYFKSALRHLSRSRIYAVINIVGLATGITAMLLAILFWRDEVSYDRFHSNSANLYRVVTTLREYKDQDPVTIGGTGQVQGPLFAAEIPEVKSFTRVLGGDITSNLVANNKTIKVYPLFVDDNFLQLFSFPLLSGSSASSLKRAEDVVLTASTARKIFNSIDVIGKTISLDADPSFQRLGKPLIVSAVVTDPPANSSIQFDVLFSSA